MDLSVPSSEIKPDLPLDGMLGAGNLLPGRTILLTAALSCWRSCLKSTGVTVAYSPGVLGRTLMRSQVMMTFSEKSLEAESEKAAVTAEGQEVFNHLPELTDDDDALELNEYELFIRKLDKHYLPKGSIIFERYHFERRNQKETKMV
ncbi:hypothetical protein NDU88_010495 [Pleurodeles waltl]|uniref:Uncharacterized protein n=1 Tax=Pleurodeles waltl TaxID=8319 RepID=A0AAV7Q0B0_PLEWA|nr:hypothetical protein NDU88_010495 [Pleurodeles waltl]